MIPAATEHESMNSKLGRHMPAANGHSTGTRDGLESAFSPERRRNVPGGRKLGRGVRQGGTWVERAGKREAWLWATGVAANGRPEQGLLSRQQ